MKMMIKTMALLLFAAVMSGGVTAFCQDNGEGAWPPTAWDWPNNNYTNKVVIPTVKLYTNTQAAIVNDQQYRVRQETATGKGATTLQRGPRIEPRTPAAYVASDPWVQRDHAWDVNPNMPITESPGPTNNTVIDRTQR